MELSKKYYTIDEPSYKKLIEKINDAESQLKQYNQEFIENKNLDTNLNNELWQKRSERLVPIISQGVSQAKATPSASNQIDENDFITQLEQCLGSKFQTKGLKFYQFLKKVDGVQVQSNGIRFEDEFISGNPALIICNIIKNIALLSYDTEGLISWLVSQGYGDTLLKLIGNKEGKNIVTQMMLMMSESEMRHPPTSYSTPYKTGEDYDDPEETVKNQKGSNKISDREEGWVTLFGDNGGETTTTTTTRRKGRKKQNGRKKTKQNGRRRKKQNGNKGGAKKNRRTRTSKQKK